MKKMVLTCLFLFVSAGFVYAEEPLSSTEQVVVETGDSGEGRAVTEGQVPSEEQSVAQTMDVVAEPTATVEEQVERKVPFWIKIRTKIERITPQKKPVVTTAVGGVRGAKNEAGNELYWKGEEVEVKVDEQELAEFDNALKKAEAGEIESARRLFEKFVNDFPESELKPDAVHALNEMDNDLGRSEVFP